MCPRSSPRKQRDAASARAAEVLGIDDRVVPHSIRHQVRMEQAIQLGQPPFPHAAHIAGSICTGGVWLVGYWAFWMTSKRRRYQRERRRALQAEGLL